VTEPLYAKSYKKSTRVESAERDGGITHKEQSAKAKEFLVRVLLSKVDNNEPDELVISCDAGIVVNGSDMFDHQRNVQQIKVSMKNGELSLNGKRCLKKRIVLQPKDGLIRLGDNSYKGFFWLVVKSDCVQLINSVLIEDYVFASLRSEVWPGWPLEVYKVCAVAIRTYLITKIREARGSSELYHIKNTSEHQTYYGNNFMKRDDALIHKAVAATEGEFLTYRGCPIVAMYDSCCGGITPSKMEGIDFDRYPYLKRTHACTYCKNCKTYRWKITRSVDKWSELFRKEFPSLVRIRSVRVVHRDAAGLVRSVEISDGKHSFKITGSHLHGMGCGIKSCTFTIQKEGSNITFKGKGVGHQTGLCQRGACEMVRAGYDYRSVLLYYYPGVAFAHLD
jgi:stage II sporulation protein D